MENIILIMRERWELQMEIRKGETEDTVILDFLDEVPSSECFRKNISEIRGSCCCVILDENVPMIFSHRYGALPVFVSMSRFA